MRYAIEFVLQLTEDLFWMWQELNRRRSNRSTFNQQAIHPIGSYINHSTTGSSRIHSRMPSSSSTSPPDDGVLTTVIAAIYVLSGMCQPILMTYCTHAGLADSTAQLYMLFYYLGPSLVVFWTATTTIVRSSTSSTTTTTTTASLQNGYEMIPQQQHHKDEEAAAAATTTADLGNDNTINPGIPFLNRPLSTTVIGKACGIAVFDIAAQSFNYTGASYAGATIFAVIYSSVTIWTALFNYCILHRRISYMQWLAIFVVMIGLSITSLDSISFGSDVIRGTIYILIGSCMHGATYVLSEAIMITSHTDSSAVLRNYAASSHSNGCAVLSHLSNKKHVPCRDSVTCLENSAIQGLVACGGLFLWQLIYTIPNWDNAIRQPTLVARTTIPYAITLLLSFTVSNLFHSLSFYYTVAHYPGGSISAGVMKALQAVLVFIVAHILFCTSNGTTSTTTMCFSYHKLLSLITVVGGVTLFRLGNRNHTLITDSKWIENHKETTTIINNCGYSPILDATIGD